MWELEGFASAQRRRDWTELLQKSVKSRRDEMVECSLLKKLQLTAGKMLREKAVGEKVKRFDAAQQAVIADLQRRVEYYELVENKDDMR